MNIIAGTTNVSIDIRCMTSAGAALEGKVAADFPTMWYRRDGAKVDITLSNLLALTTAHTDGGLKEIADGWYRLDLPDLACAAGANHVAIGGTVTGGVILSAPIYLDNLLTTALVQSYSTVGAAPTLSQAIFELLAMRNTQIVDTTRTAYQIDGTTPAMTLTLGLDVDGNPYKQNRTT